MSDKAKKVEVEVAQPITLEESFDIVLNKLARLEQGMLDSDREVYRAVGEFVDNTAIFAQNMVDIALDSEGLNSESISEGSFSKQLQQRFEFFRSKADQLLLTADSDEEIDRALKLEQFLDRIIHRINSLALIEGERKQDNSLEKLSITQLRTMAKQRKLKAYSKLKKHELVELLSQ